MKIKLLAGAALAALAMATASVASAEGLYGAVDLGYNLKSNFKNRSAANGPDGNPYAWDHGR